jgi:hypothetical protein
MSDAYWDVILQDPRGRSGGIPIQNRRLSEIPRHVLRVSCRRCDRTVEIQTPDAVRLYGQHAIWKDVGGVFLIMGASNVPAAVRTTAAGPHSTRVEPQRSRRWASE